jgi:hypothetical protein
MSSAKEFGEYVRECIVRAESAKTELERDFFRQKAKAWLEAALIANGASPGSSTWTEPPSNK